MSQSFADVYHEIENRIRGAYRSSLGKKRREIVTLILDLDVARRNKEFMANRLKSLHAKLRPHIKVQKNVELAK